MSFNLRATLVQTFSGPLLRGRITPSSDPAERMTRVGGSAPEEDSLPVEGDVIDGHYRLVRRLGEGMFGCVYLAERTDVPEHRVALKVVNRAVYGGRDVERELVMLAASTHPHVVQLKDHGMTADYVWLTMPLYEGETLAERLERGPLTLREAYEVFLPIARGVHALHQRGLRHQDIKPENIYLADIGGTVHPVLLDLGVAVEARSPFVAGTALYCSPEQIAALGGLEDGHGELSEKMDTYGLAATLLRSLVGPDDFPGEDACSPFDIANAFEQREISALSWPAMPDLTGEPRQKLRAALSRWLMRDPDMRPDTGAFAKELDVLLDQEREAAAAIEASLAKQKISLKRFRVALAATLVLGSGVALWGVAHRETLRLARELEHARAVGADSFDKLDTCVAAHRLAKDQATTCRATRDKERGAFETRLVEQQRTHVATASRLRGEVDRGGRRLRICADEKEAAMDAHTEEQTKLSSQIAERERQLTVTNTELAKARQERDNRAESLATCRSDLKSSIAERTTCESELASCISERDALRQPAPPAASASPPSGAPALEPPPEAPSTADAAAALAGDGG